MRVPHGIFCEATTPRLLLGIATVTKNSSALSFIMTRGGLIIFVIINDGDNDNSDSDKNIKYVVIANFRNRNFAIFHAEKNVIRKFVKPRNYQINCRAIIINNLIRD
jgi:hypothetical protein